MRVVGVVVVAVAVVVDIAEVRAVGRVRRTQPPVRGSRQDSVNNYKIQCLT